MQLATFRTHSGGTCAAVLRDEQWQAIDADDVGEVLKETGLQEILPSTKLAVLDGLEEPLPVVLNPAKVVCCGHNYRAHIAEMGHPVPDHPTLFTKFADTLTGATSNIEIPAYASDSIDWEAELAVVVGATLHRADRATASRGIAGYTVANDISVRTWQRRTGQWLPGKAFDGTTPMGPMMVTADEVDPSDGLTIRCRVNGVEYQRASTNDLVFDAADMLCYISSFTVLRPGDIVLTGTPGGVGAAHTPPRFLTDGDVVETSIEGIGTMRNQIRVT